MSDMNQPYLEVTYRAGHALAAYYYLPRRPGQKCHRTVEAAPGILVDYGRNGRAIGIEIPSPGIVTLRRLNRVLRELGQATLTSLEYAPLRAA